MSSDKDLHAITYLSTRPWPWSSGMPAARRRPRLPSRQMRPRLLPSWDV